MNDLFDVGCVLCGDKQEIEVHHVDWHHENNKAGNRVKVCRSCHVWIHKRGGYITLSELQELGKRIKEWG